MDNLKKVIKAGHEQLKKTRLISKSLKDAGFHKLASHASIAGYGRRKRRKRRTTA